MFIRGFKMSAYSQFLKFAKFILVDSHCRSASHSSVTAIANTLRLSF